MTEEQVLEKVKKLLNLANDSDSEESKTALAMAHELMAKYNVQLEQLEVDPELSLIDCESLGTKGTSWYQRSLACELAKRYGCQIILVKRRSTGVEFIQVAGVRVNCLACIESLKFAYNAYQTCFKHWVKKYEGFTKEWKQKARKAYFVGFVEGIITEMRRVECSTALVIHEPADLAKFVDSQTNRKTFKLQSANMGNATMEEMSTASEGYRAGVYSYRNKNSAIDQKEESVFQPSVTVFMDQVKEYERIRAEGKYDMDKDAREVADLIGISLGDYWHIRRNYNAYLNYYGIPRMN